MTPKANLYALAALRDRRAIIASEIAEFERKLRHLRESLVHVDATLKILDPRGRARIDPEQAASSTRKAVPSG